MTPEEMEIAANEINDERDRRPLDPEQEKRVDNIISGTSSGNVVRHHSSFAPAANAELRDCPTNLDLTTAKGKAMAIAAGNPGDIEFDLNGKAYCRACYYILYPDVTYDRDSGEERQVTRTVLITSVGETYKTTSDWAPSRLKAILSLYSAEDWQAGIPIVITERRSRKTGRTYHDIRVQLEDGKPARATKKA